MALTPADAEAKARDWCAAWNRRDLEAVLGHYADDVEVCSPLVVRRLGRRDGVLRGKEEMRAYFGQGMRNDALHFTFEDVRMGAGWMTVLYARENGMRVSDTMKLGPDGRVVEMIACYAGGESDV